MGSFFIPKPTAHFFAASKNIHFPPLTKTKNFLIFGAAKRPYRLVAQDSGFSFPQQRFETAWGYSKKKEQQSLLFFYTHKPTVTTGIKRTH